MKKSINFNWEFLPKFKKEYLNNFPSDKAFLVDIPHNVNTLPYNYFNEKVYQHLSTYRKIFTLDKLNSNQSIYLRFEAFMLKAKIYLNKQYLGEYISSYSPVEINIEDNYKEGENELLVILDSNEDNSIPPFGYAVDYLTFGGIYREVSLHIVPKIYIQKSLINADMNGKIHIKDIISNINNKPYQIKHQIYYHNTLVTESGKDEFSLEQPYLWDLESPNLYTLKTILTSEYGESIYQCKFGFRTITFKKEGFYLNNRKIKLMGLNRHQSYPYCGYAMAKSAQEDDANILKFEAGINVVRTSHYMQSEHFLNRCDEIGLLVINEIPGWQHISKEKIWREKHYKNVKDMVIEEYNHPSLIAHGVRIDESQDDYELYFKSNQIARDLDFSRPTLGVRNFTNSQLLEDIYAYNDFICRDLSKGLTNPKHIKTCKHPYLVTEYLGHMEPTKATDSEKQRIYHALRHALVINDNYKFKNLIGAIGWCFADYYTHNDFGSGDHICPHGVFDMYRNPKYAASIYASQQDQFPVIQVLSNMKPGDFEESSLMDVYVATNADYIKLYKNDEYVGTFKPNTKQYKYLPHPLILIDDLVGKTFNDSRFKLKDRMILSKLLSYIAFHGYANLGLKRKLSIAKLMIKYKLSHSDLVDLYNTHIASWGGKAKKYKFVAYKNNVAIKEQTFGPSEEYHLDVKANKQELINEETYDVSRVIIKYVDDYKNVLNYANKVVNLDVSGPIEIIGPNQVSLLGGQISVYIRSLNKIGNATLTISCENQIKSIKFTIKNK